MHAHELLSLLFFLEERERESKSATMLLMRQCQATLMLAAAAALLHGQSLGLGQAAVTHRWETT